MHKMSRCKTVFWKKYIGCRNSLEFSCDMHENARKNQYIRKKCNKFTNTSLQMRKYYL